METVCWVSGRRRLIRSVAAAAQHHRLTARVTVIDISTVLGNSTKMLWLDATHPMHLHNPRWSAQWSASVHLSWQYTHLWLRPGQWSSTAVKLASAAFGRLSHCVFLNHNLTTTTKVAVYKVICICILLYGCDLRDMDPISPSHKGSGAASVFCVFSLGLYFVYSFVFLSFVCPSPSFYVSLGSWVITLTVFGASVTNLNEPPRALAAFTIAWVRSQRRW